MGQKMPTPRTDDLLERLREVAGRTLRAAGPRYAPSLDPKAPNLAIRPLQRAGVALAHGTALGERARALAADVRSAYDREERFADRFFARRTANLRRLSADLDELASSTAVTERRQVMQCLRRHLRAVREHLSTANDQMWSRLQELDVSTSDAVTDEGRRTRSAERDRVQSWLSSIRRLEEATDEISDFADGREGDLIARKRSVLLIGEWGTGKTHFLCDFALQMIADGTPTLVVLANALRTDVPPLDAIAELTGLADSGAALIAMLDAKARSVGRRALVMIDALNESDREVWRRNLPKLLREIETTDSVGLVVSCRTPFDTSVVTQSARKRMVQLRHPGFEDQEFDAQLEFFEYYGLPALHVPLLTSEFSRPLFLRLMCEGIKDLNKRSQQSQLRDLASGEKSMTYVLERFVKKVGAEVEKNHNLAPASCWQIMKGDPRNCRAGLAGVLAAERREWLAQDEAIREVRAFADANEQAAVSIIESMVAAGLLIEHSRYEDGGYVDVFLLPYQRFSDHLVARHLLDAHLETSSPERVRRCFFKNQRLGAVFILDWWGGEFAEPGIASALMIEFPERMRRLADREGSPTELLQYLPRQRRLVRPVADAFLEGLYWRPLSSIGSGTKMIVEFLLQSPEQDYRSRTYEVLAGLSMRRGHPLGSEWLIARLSSLSIAQRDIEWSEFIRTAEPDSNLHRLLAWAEREEHDKVEWQVASQAIRITALLLTTTDRLVRDRATRALVLMGEACPQRLFQEVPELLAFGDPYIIERVVAACYGVCMRVWTRESSNTAFRRALLRLGTVLLEQILRPDAPHATWHALIRGYAIGVLQILQQVRRGAIDATDRKLLELAPGQAPSPFRAVSQIRKRDIEDPEHAIGMDFGNYTIGGIVDGRSNYDFKHREYAGVRKQIADRMRRLGYSTELFARADKVIAECSEYRREGSRVDRYGKKYSWIAFFEMYGLRRAEARFSDDYYLGPRTSDSDIDPSFPVEIRQWSPPKKDLFASSPVDVSGWIASGETPDYSSILWLPKVDGVIGDWVLLDAAMHEGSGDGREVRGWVTSVFAPPSSVDRLRREVDAGRDLRGTGFAELGADYYTYHGEVPWSARYGSDVRTTRGQPKRLNDRAFDYFDREWRRGVPVENSCRRWSWEDYHSQLNQVGEVIFPAPPMAEALKLRVAGGSSDMLDENGKVATIFRQADGPGFGSRFLYMRRDLVERYASGRNLRVVHAVFVERNVSYKVIRLGLSESLRSLFQAGVHQSSRIIGLEP